MWAAGGAIPQAGGAIQQAGGQAEYKEEEEAI